MGPKGPKKKPRTNVTTSKPEVLHEAEPPDPRARSPDKDSASMDDAIDQNNAAANAPLSGDERHVTTMSPEQPSESLNPLTMWKGKARSLSPQQYRSRETFLSPKQSKSAVIDRGEYIFPTSEEDAPLGTRPSPRTSNELTTTDDSQDLYGRRKLRKRVDPASQNPDRYTSRMFDDEYAQRREHLVARNPTPTQSALEALRPTLVKPDVRTTNIQYDEDANISSAYENIFNPR